MAHAPAGPEDYMIATGETHSVREFAELVFTEGGIEGNPRYYRPTEVAVLIGNPTKAKEKLGWEAKVGFEELVKMMVEGDLKKLYIVCSCNIKRGTYNDSVI